MYDEYEEVINSDETYETIAASLSGIFAQSVIIGWTDGKGSHLDIMFTYSRVGPATHGHLQRGIKRNDLFVSIFSIGSFGFAVTELPLSSGYVAEKLGFVGPDATTEALAELIMGVRKLLLK